MTLMLNLFSVLAICALILSAGRPVGAFPADRHQSVVSVLPEWPGQVQGGTGAPPGVAPEGSGVAIGPGLIATAWHVVEPAEAIEVRLFDGRILSADLVAADAATDIAVLSIDAELTHFAFGDGIDMIEPVCALGNAFGLGVSVTCGVVSAVGVTDAGFNAVEDFVQTDAAVNPGMSGGALIDADGTLVGMLSAIFASGGDANIGVNFAVSAALLKRVTDALVRDGEVRVPVPGWRLAIPDRATMTRLAAPVVQAVAPGGPADIAGLRPGDLVIEVGGRAVATPRDAVAALSLVPQDASDVLVRIDRAGTRETLRVVFAGPAAPESETPSATPEDCPHPAEVCVIRQAVFPVSSFDPLGSATRIGADLLVTNRHVVGDRSDATVFTPSGPRAARVLASAYPGDLVLLEVPGLPNDGIIPDLDVDAPPVAPFFSVGADIAREEVRVFDPGVLIAQPAPEADLGRLHVTARMQPGVSGGALVTQDGNLAGIAVGGGDGRFEAIPVTDVVRLLALRDDKEAAQTTARLGEAFGLCGASIESVAVLRIVKICAEAGNHGQLLEAGRVLAQAGDFDAAAKLHGAAVAQVPNSVNARISLLVSLQLGARFEDMTVHARRVMELAPEDPQALRFAIQSGVWGDDPALAEEGYAALLSADPVQAQAARRFIDAAPPAPARR